MPSKLQLMLVTWFVALALSAALRFWGIQHPLPFVIRPSVVWSLLMAPSILLGLWALSALTRINVNE